MFTKVFVLFNLCAGAAALTLQADDAKPVDFSEELNSDTSPAKFSREYRMDLVRQFQQYTFDDFVSEHDKVYTKDSPEYKKRAAIFYRRKAETIRLAGISKLSWTPAMNKFLDHTKAEINARLGYKKNAKNKRGGNGHGLSLFRGTPMGAVPASFVALDNCNWFPNMTYSADFQKDQGACGSCWAVATVEALEAHADIHYGSSVPLSMQELVSCTPNLAHCGGTGGCGGATVELAMDYLATLGGIQADDTYPYTSGSGADGTCTAASSAPVVLTDGYTQVPSNNLQALMYAVSQGPVAIAVAASAWSFYGGGIFNSCAQDAVLNHAVLLLGYGAQGDRGYWIIRNSWGHDWGEEGQIRLSRSLTATAANYCGMDNSPGEGSACEGDDEPVQVCGMCGILYEPVLVHVGGVNTPANFNEIIAKVKSNKKANFAKRKARKIKY